jgi:hypothetical protein
MSIVALLFVHSSVVRVTDHTTEEAVSCSYIDPHTGSLGATQYPPKFLTLNPIPVIDTLNRNLSSACQEIELYLSSHLSHSTSCSEACNRLDKGVGEAEGLSTGRDPTTGPSRNPGRRSGGKTQRNDRKPVHQSELPLKLNMAIMMRLRDQAVARAMAAFKPTRATMRPIAVHVEEDQLSPTQTRGRANPEDAGLRAMTRKKTMCPRGGRNPYGGSTESKGEHGTYARDRDYNAPRGGRKCVRRLSETQGEVRSLRPR